MQSPHNPTKYMGPNVFMAPTVTVNRRPTSTDLYQPTTGKYYAITTFWQVGKNPTTGVEGEVWVLTKIVANVAFWELITVGGSGGGTVVSLTGNDGVVVNPDSDGNIDIITANANVKFLGTTNTLTVNFGGANLLLGSSGVITSGGQNAGYGMNALAATTVGGSNVAIGFQALPQNQGGSANTALGNRALLVYNPGVTMTQTLNVAVGSNALNQLTTGTNNIAVGSLSGTNYTTSESSNILLGNAGTLAESNTMRLGTQGGGAGQVNRAFAAGITGVTTANSNVVTLNSSTGQLGAYAATNHAVQLGTSTGGLNSLAPATNGYAVLCAPGTNPSTSDPQWITTSTSFDATFQNFNGSYTSQTGRWLRFGNMTMVQINMDWTGNSSMGDMRITNMPFVSGAALSHFPGVVICSGVTLPASTVQVYCDADGNNSAVLKIMGLIDGGNPLPVQMSASGTLSITQIYFTVSV